MYGKITKELFSNLISKINKIPNYSTPFKENPYLTPKYKIFNLFNMNHYAQETYSTIFENIKNDEIRYILLDIIELIATKYSSFNEKIADDNSDLNNLFGKAWTYFKNQSNYLKNFRQNQIQNENYIKELEKIFKEAVSVFCGLINIMVQMFSKHFSILEKSDDEIFITKEIIQNEINMLFIINKNRVWLEPLITLLDQIFKFVLENNFYKLFGFKLEKYKKLMKEESISKNEILKIIDSYINYIIDDKKLLLNIFYVVKKYSCIKNIDETIIKIIPFGELNALMQNFFNVFIPFLLNKPNLLENESLEKSITIGNYLLNCLINSKYLDPNYGVDFIGYFFGAQNFIDETFDTINNKLIESFNSVVVSLKDFECHQFAKINNLNLYQNFENILKDYLIYSMITCYNKDSLCDCYMNCQSYKPIFTTCGLVRIYIVFGKNIEKYQRNIKYLIKNIFEESLVEINKYKTILPVKLFLWKNYYTQSMLVFFHAFVKNTKNILLEIYKDKKILLEKLDVIKDLVSSINCLFFILGNDIMYLLNLPCFDGNNEKKEKNGEPITLLRIIDDCNPMDYNTVVLSKVSNPLNNNFYGSPLKDSNKENVNQNKQSNSQQIRNIDSFLGNSFFNELFKDGRDIEVNSSVFQTEAKRKKEIAINELFYRYEITDFVNKLKGENGKKIELLEKIGFEYKIENEKHYLYIDSNRININYNQIAYITQNDATNISLYNNTMCSLFKKEPFTKQIIEQLFISLLDGLDDSNKGKNSLNSLKYYDTSFSMDYFSFVEKAKELLI